METLWLSFDVILIYLIVYSFSSDPEGELKKLSTRFEVSATNFWVRNVKTSEVGDFLMYEREFPPLEKFSENVSIIILVTRTIDS